MQESKEVTFAPGLMADGILSEIRDLGKEYMRLMSYYSSAMLEIETKFKVLSIEFNGKSPDVEIAFYHAIAQEYRGENGASWCAGLCGQHRKDAQRRRRRAHHLLVCG